MLLPQHHLPPLCFSKPGALRSTPPPLFPEEEEEDEELKVPATPPPPTPPPELLNVRPSDEDELFPEAVPIPEEQLSDVDGGDRAFRSCLSETETKDKKKGNEKSEDSRRSLT